jgi:hypothetical protein
MLDEAANPKRLPLYATEMEHVATDFVMPADFQTVNQFGTLEKVTIKDKIQFPEGKWWSIL